MSPLHKPIANPDLIFVPFNLRLCFLTINTQLIRIQTDSYPRSYSTFRLGKLFKKTTFIEWHFSCINSVLLFKYEIRTIVNIFVSCFQLTWSVTIILNHLLNRLLGNSVHYAVLNNLPRQNLFYTFRCPHIENCWHAWFDASDAHLEIPDKIQRRICSVTISFFEDQS